MIDLDPEDIPVANEYSRDDFGTPDEVRGWNLCRDYVIEMLADHPLRAQREPEAIDDWQAIHIGAQNNDPAHDASRRYEDCEHCQGSLTFLRRQPVIPARKDAEGASRMSAPGTGLGEGCTALCRPAQHAFYCGTGTGKGWRLHGRESTAEEVAAHGPGLCPYCAEQVAERLEHAALGEWECHDRPAFDWPHPSAKKGEAAS